MNLHLTPDNIAGLVVGEGCFYAESRPDPKYRLGWRIRPAFCIEMRADELEVLNAVKETLRCGSLYHLDFGRYAGYQTKGWAPHVKFRVTRLNDLAESVVPFFRTNRLFGRKAMAFDIFAELVVLLVEKRHRTVEGLYAGRELAERLADHNQRGTTLSKDRG